jgi:phosphoserine phosphatase
VGLVLVDLDGTLLAGATSERRFVAQLLATRRLGPSQAASALSFALRRWPEYGLRTFKKNKAYLAGLPAAEVAGLAQAFARESLVPQLRAPLLQRLERHRQSGDQIG